MASIFQGAKAAFFNPTYGWKTTHFWGPIFNWGIVIAGVSDMTKQGPDMISLPMTTTLIAYSAMFMRFAWRVAPRNYLLLACHIFNSCVQTLQLYRKLKHEQMINKVNDIKDISPSQLLSGAVVTTGLFVPQLQRKVCNTKFIASKPWLKDYLESPAGPFTIFFWCPWTKWGLSIANIIDYKRPIEKISINQQFALTMTGAIWTRYSFVIYPVNYNLALVNAALFCTGAYQCTRKLVYDPFPSDPSTPSSASSIVPVIARAVKL